MVDRGETDVLVAAAVAGDVVRVEKFVVVEAGVAVRRARRRRHHQPARQQPGLAAWAISSRNATPVETKPSAVFAGLAMLPTATLVTTARRRVDRTDELREACGGIRNEVAVGVDDDFRDVMDVLVVEFDAEDVHGLRLDVRPGGEAAARCVAAVEQAAGRLRLAVNEDVLAQEELVR